MRFCVAVPIFMVEELLGLAARLDENKPDMSVVLGMEPPNDIQKRLAEAIVEGINEGRRKAVFTLPADDEILTRFEIEARVERGRAQQLTPRRWRDREDRGSPTWHWTRLLLHTFKAQKAARRPWLIQLADCANG